jgi:UDP-glucuronate 4-epimerase
LKLAPKIAILFVTRGGNPRPARRKGKVILSQTILVTGAAGFIGSHVAQRLVERGDTVVALDNFNDYYDPQRKEMNLAEVRAAAHAKGRGAHLHEARGDLRDREFLAGLFSQYNFDSVVNLAAMAGVRVSINDPQLYYDVNCAGALNLLDGVVGRLTNSKPAKLATFILASTSSAYGNTKTMPFVESDPCNEPLAPYAASKRAAELLLYSYHFLYKVPATVLRFFNVYGPRGRPDMMAYKVLDSVFSGKPVPYFDSGQMHRDWTFVNDIASGVVAACDHPQNYEVINLGRGKPVLVADFVDYLQELAGGKANLMPEKAPDADIVYTYADISKAQRLLGYDPQVSVEEGCRAFWQWYQNAVLAK